MWQYTWLEDLTKFLDTDISGGDLLFRVQQISKCSDIDLDDSMHPYATDTPPPEVLLFF